MTTQTTDIKLFHLVSRVHQALFRASDHALSVSAGISTTQSAVLMYLQSHELASMGELAEAVGIKLTSASGLMDRMAAKELIKRERSSVDARTVVLSLTDKGAAVAQEIQPWVKQMNDTLLDEAGSSEEIQTFKTVCERLIAGVNNTSITSDLSARRSIEGNESTIKKGSL